MSAWSLLAVPLCLCLVVALLWGVAAFEQRMLSPRAMILYTARCRRAGPEAVESLIAIHSEPLLRNLR